MNFGLPPWLRKPLSLFPGRISTLPALLCSCLVRRPGLQILWPTLVLKTPPRQLQTFIARHYRTKDSIVQWHAFKDLAQWSQSVVYPISPLGLCRISRFQFRMVGQALYTLLAQLLATSGFQISGKRHFPFWMQSDWNKLSTWYVAQLPQPWLIPFRSDQLQTETCRVAPWPFFYRGQVLPVSGGDRLQFTSYLSRVWTCWSMIWLVVEC